MASHVRPRRLLPQATPPADLCSHADPCGDYPSSSQIGMVLADLGQQVVELRKTVEVLGDRLRPVRRPHLEVEEKTGGCAGDSDLCSVAREIRDDADAVRVSIRLLNEILSTLEV